jgi:hypothetical protein
MMEAKVPVYNESLNLMEFCQMGIIKSFIAEDSINGEELSWSEGFFFSDHLQIPRRDGGGMGS